MGSCWWWKIDGTEVVQSEAKGRLVKVATRTATVDLSSVELKKHGYPKMPPRTAQWEDASESYLLCSTKLPVYISYDEDKKRYMGTIPFDQQGETAGATEGVGNLYRAVCDGGKKVTFAIDPKTEAWDIPLDKPTDIFSH